MFRILSVEGPRRVRAHKHVCAPDTERQANNNLAATLTLTPSNEASRPKHATSKKTLLFTVHPSPETWTERHDIRAPI